jgi:hypothetical protein
MKTIPYTFDNIEKIQALKKELLNITDAEEYVMTMKDCPLPIGVKIGISKLWLKDKSYTSRDLREIRMRLRGR